MNEAHYTLSYIHAGKFPLASLVAGNRVITVNTLFVRNSV